MMLPSHLEPGNGIQNDHVVLRVVLTVVLCTGGLKPKMNLILHPTWCNDDDKEKSIKQTNHNGM